MRPNELSGILLCFLLINEYQEPLYSSFQFNTLKPALILNAHQPFVSSLTAEWSKNSTVSWYPISEWTVHWQEHCEKVVGTWWM